MFSIDESKLDVNLNSWNLLERVQRDGCPHGMSVAAARAFNHLLYTGVAIRYG